MGVQSPLGRTGLAVSPLGFGAFKIGRNQGIKYPNGYELPDDAEVEFLLNAVLDLGINLIDTAPAYGISEERVGRFLSAKRDEFVLSTKVGETWTDGTSVYDYSADAIQHSLERSLQRLQTDRLDLVFIHSNGDDLKILHETPVVSVLQSWKQQGLIRGIGLSGKTVAGAQAAMEWADVLMVEYHLQDQSHRELMQQASEQGIGILVKKGLASGHLSPGDAIHFVLNTPEVSSLVVGGLNLDHLRSNMTIASESRSSKHVA